MHCDVDVYRQAIRNLFPYGIDADEALHYGRCPNLLGALNAHLEKTELAEAIDIRSKLTEISDEKCLPLHSALRDFCDNLGSGDLSQHAIAKSWQQIVS